VTALQNLGHEVVPFRPPNLTRVQEVYGAFLSADVNHFLRKRLQQGPVSMHSIALIYMTCIWPSWKKKLAGLYCAFKVGDMSHISYNKQKTILINNVHSSRLY
jgi:hypothetical protein